MYCNLFYFKYILFYFADQKIRIKYNEWNIFIYYSCQWIITPLNNIPIIIAQIADITDKIGAKGTTGNEVTWLIWDGLYTMESIINEERSFVWKLVDVEV